MNRAIATPMAAFLMVAGMAGLVPPAAANHNPPGPVDDALHAHAYHPINETMDRVCHLDPAAPDGILCEAAGSAKSIVYAALPIAFDMGNAFLFLVEYTLDEWYDCVSGECGGGADS